MAHLPSDTIDSTTKCGHLGLVPLYTTLFDCIQTRLFIGLLLSSPVQELLQRRNWPITTGIGDTGGL